MALYGDIATVKKMVRPDEYATFGPDLDDRLTAIQAAISLDLEERTGRVFGVTATDVSEIHWIGPYDSLVLNRPARSITSIRYGGTLTGDTMTGGTTVLAADLYTTIRDPRTGYIYSVASANANVWSWYLGDPLYTQSGHRTPVVVTADFIDTDDDTDVPADVTYAANILILKTYQIENASPAGFTGADGSTMPISDPWKHPSVKAVISKYTVQKWVV